MVVGERVNSQASARRIDKVAEDRLNPGGGNPGG